jgi:transmembrane 9 superfamily protein 2/4
MPSLRMGPLALVALVGLVAAQVAHGFYLPGVAPQDYARDDIVNLKVNKLSSTKTQLPYEYYSLPYCRPDPIVNSAENLGEVLRGDRIENSLYQIEIRLDEQCKVVCKIDALTPSQAKDFKSKVDDEYRVNMILDNLPVGMVKIREENGKPVKTYERGYPVGFKAAIEEGGEQKHFLHNHLRFTILYHKDVETDLARIVGFEVEPFSVKHEYEAPWDPVKPSLETCHPGRMQYVTHGLAPQMVEEGEEVIFSYDVVFKMSNIRWASRWDTYLLMMDDQIHWFSIVNSLMIVLFLSGMVAMIMLRTLHRDISKYNQLETADEAQEETGWKLVHGDVFRPPSAFGALTVYIGTGVQLVGMTVVTLVFAVLGFLSPANRGGLMTAMLLLFALMGLFAGHASARLFKMFQGTDWKANTLNVAFLFPSAVFVIFFGLNLLIWGQKSSGAVPFGTLFALFFLWFGISVPLVFIGSYFGFKKPAVEDPVRTNKIPRQIPEQAWYMHPLFSVFIGGVLPFGAVFIELFFILTSMWLHQFYYLFGFLFIVFLILIVTCAEITIVLCYFQLCSEDYHWWWRSFLTSGSSALYLLCYSMFYFATKLDISRPVSGVLYFGYMFIISLGFFLLTGTIGFYACFLFVRTIYAAVKID